MTYFVCTSWTLSSAAALEGQLYAFGKDQHIEHIEAKPDGCCFFWPTFLQELTWVPGVVTEVCGSLSYMVCVQPNIVW